MKHPLQTRYESNKVRSVQLPSKTLDWLLEDNNPPVRNLTKVHFHNLSLTGDEIEEVNEYAPIKKIVSLINSDGSWGNPKNPYKKYTGDYWQLIFLCDLNANSNDLIQQACQKIISYQLPTGGFTHKIGSKFALICLTANILRSLIHFKIEDERIAHGIDYVTDRIVEEEGAFCSPDPLYTLLPDCQMALIKVLAMYSTMESKTMSTKRKQAVKIIENKLVENRIFRYIPIGAKEYHKLIRGKKTKVIRELRKEFLTESKNLEKQDIKKSWLKFGFPQSYTSDVLETLYWLSKSSSSYHNEFDEAIDCVINAMDAKGYWTNQLAFRNPMLVEIEAKNSPSKWLTFRAYFILQNYCKVEFKD